VKSISWLKCLSSFPTVPSTSQITFSRAISSTSISFEWSNVTGADSYILFVEKLFSSPLEQFNWTFTALSGQIEGLAPSTTYNCYLYSSNSAGRGAKSNTKTIMTLTVTDSDPVKAPVIRNTSATSMDISNLEPCSSYTMGVSSVNVFLVPGEPYNISYSTSIPCAPTNVSVSVDCSHDSARFNWTASIGVVFYITVAEDADGNIHSCNSMGTNCLVEGLRCGQKYNASIIGTNLNCNSTASEGVTFTTGMSTNHQPTGVYTTTLEEANGARLTCTSNTVNNCNITSLPCGRKYNVTVTYNDGTCSSSSTQIRMDSVPADNYTTKISRAVGQPLHCNSTDMQCTAEGLVCGSSYVVNVFSITGTCISLPMPCPPTNVTAPCSPLNVSSRLICSTNTAQVSWAASANAATYTVTAGSEGQTITCNSPSTNCTLSNLVCGRYPLYFYTKKQFSNSHFISSFSVPCAPANISTNLLCGTNDLVVNWSSSSVPLNYSVKVVALAGNISSLTCDTKHANCSLSGLQCGQTYNVSVKASSKSCSGPYNDGNEIRTTIFSFASQGATSYTARVTGPHGFSKTCSSSNLTCFVSDLQCASQYNVTVTAQDGHCTSSTTHTVISTGGDYNILQLFS
uniref:Fibronectin type-III domain-containing protein n=1 Tax=Takifugu rubripes TaxID=31033 RepID=A0A674MQ79_TAKRU